MKINNSLEWSSVRDKLNQHIISLPYDRSIRQMLKNIDAMVDELSKFEVEARRTKITYYSNEKLSAINDAIVSLDKIIVIAILMS